MGLMMKNPLHEITARMRKEITNISDDLGVRTSFANGRRESDILIVKVRGDKDKSFQISRYVLTYFRNVDIEFISSGYENTDYKLVFVVTESLGKQEILDSERRSKLKRLAGEYEEW